MFLQADPGAGAALIQLLLPFAIMFAVFYFVLLRPQKAQQKKRQEMLDSLKKGDQVVTVGGVYGEITAAREDYVTLKVADKVELKVSRAGINGVVK